MSDTTSRPSRFAVVSVVAALAGVSLLLVGAAGQAQEVAPAPAPPPEVPFDEKKAALDSAIELRIGGNEGGAEIQKLIDAVADETDAVAARYRTALKQVEAIRKFNDQMRALIDSQRAELASVADQLDRIEEVGRNVTPLMLRMIDALESFVDLDVPFLRDERKERIASLRILMDRADVSSATKFRQIMEAYQTENEYGRTIEAYRGRVRVGEGETIADLLRFGRIGLVFQTLDGANSGVWNQESRAWEVLDPSFHSGIRKGLRIARKLEPPDLIALPLAPAVPGERKTGTEVAGAVSPSQESTP